MCLSADGWGWVSSLLVVWSEATLHWSLQTPWALEGLTPRSTSQNLCCQCPCPCCELQPPPASAEDPLTLAGRSASVSYGVTAPSPWVLMHTPLCVCLPRVESLFPPVLSKSFNQIPVAIKVWFSGNSSSRCWTPRLGSLTWGSEPSLQWADFCGIIVLQFVSHPPNGYGVWFYCDCAPPTISLRFLLCLWMSDIFFGEFQCLPVDDCSAVSCDSSALARGSDHTSFYSAILNQSSCFFLFFCSLLMFWWLSLVLFWICLSFCVYLYMHICVCMNVHAFFQKSSFLGALNMHLW